MLRLHYALSVTRNFLCCYCCFFCCYALLVVYCCKFLFDTVIPKRHGFGARNLLFAATANKQIPPPPKSEFGMTVFFGTTAFLGMTVFLGAVRNRTLHINSGQSAFSRFPRFSHLGHLPGGQASAFGTTD